MILFLAGMVIGVFGTALAMGLCAAASDNDSKGWGPYPEWDGIVCPSCEKWLTKEESAAGKCFKCGGE